MNETLPRKLVAIFYADVAGYSRLTGQDEDSTHRILSEYLDLVARVIETRNGTVMHYAGDAVLAKFDAVVNSVSAAVDIQNQLQEHNQDLSDERRIQFRIGINSGDVIEDRGDIYGDDVNIAARLESLADPGGICISAAVRSAIGSKLGLDFVDLGEQQVKNIVDPVRVYKIKLSGDAESSDSVVATNSGLSQDRPSIAVLPFVNMSGDPEQDYFADGIVDGITTALSRIKSFLVIARTSAFIFKDRAVTFGTVRDELGVRYFLEGGVQKAGNRVRINVQLIETEQGAHVWAEKYDGEFADIFELQDSIIEQVAGALQPNIRQAEIEHSRRKRPQDLDAYDYVLRALPHAWALDIDSNLEAVSLLNRAIELDAEYPTALSLQAWCHAQQAVYNWSSDIAASKQEAMQLARQAASLSNDDPFVLTVLGTAHTLVNDHDAATVLLERAVSIDPNTAWGWSRLAFSCVYCERPEDAIGHFRTSMRLSPHDPMIFNCYFGIGMAYSVAGDYQNAVDSFERGLLEKPDAAWIYRNLIPVYMETAREDDARKGVEILLQAYPNITASQARTAMVFSEPVLDWIYRQLVAAGLPD